MTAAESASRQYARVAVERGIDRYPEGLLYSIPQTMADLAPGDRVHVPLGRGDSQTAGIVVAVGGAEMLAGGLKAEKVKPIAERASSAQRLPGDVVRLAQWISGYYCAPIGVTLASITPSAVRKGIGRIKRIFVDLAPEAPPGKVPPKRQAVLDALARREAHERPVEVQALRDECNLGSVGPIQALLRTGHLVGSQQTRVAAKWRAQTALSGARPQLTAPQQRIVSAISSVFSKGFSQHLIWGVTGSGKTEVYLRLAEGVLAAGKSVLYLVPEISLTPQTGGRIAARFPDRELAILHSGLTQAQRHEQWVIAGKPGAKVVIGARSAVFAPIPDGQLGLIIVDEEHDSSYKQDQAPRYHGRDVAIRRAQTSPCPIVLGSATPSLESWFNATRRSLSTLHRLPERAPGLNTPRVEIVDFRAESRARADRRIHLIGPTLELALRRAFDDNGQAIVLLNRRGYANWIACPDTACGWMMQCDHCEAGMVVHVVDPGTRRGRYAQCHHCHSQQVVPTKCPRCARAVTIFGLGTQRVEEELERTFPDLAARGAIMRVDSDSMQGSTDFHDALGRFARGDVQLMLGTQMIAKGLDFPNVRVVGVVSADTALNLPDFRASERTFQLVAQVAGRCGRGNAPGRAIIQTFQPDALAIVSAARQDYEAFANREIELRKRFDLPPWHRMTRIIVRHANRGEAESIAGDLRARLIELDVAKGIVIRDAAPCPIARIADRWRMQVEMLASSPAAMQQLLACARNCGVLVPGETVAVDVDPTALL